MFLFLSHDELRRARRLFLYTGNLLVAAFTLMPCDAANILASETTDVLPSVLAEAVDVVNVEVDDLLMTCGPRSLFVWLRLQGQNVQYEDVERIVPVSTNGTSIQDLIESSHHWPCPLRAIRIGPHELDNVALPAIAHVWLDDHRATRGHYVVVIKILMDEVMFVDAASNLVQSVTREKWQSVWSGYILVQDGYRAEFMTRFAFAATLCFASYLALGFLNIGYFSPVRSNVLRTFSSFVIGLIGTILIGCSESTTAKTSTNDTATSVRAASALSSGVVKVFPLKTSSPLRDLGTVKLGSEASATFTLSNVTEQSVSLTLGRPSCSCLSATIGAELVGPRESTELALVINNRGFAGRREASVSVGAEGFGSTIFTAKALIEGLSTLPYSIKLPEDFSNYVPPPIVGEIILGPERADPQIAFTEINILEGGEQFIHLDEPVISPIEDLNGAKRFRFKIAIRLNQGIRPETKAYPVIITCNIDGITVDHPLLLNVFPRASFQPTHNNSPHETRSRAT